MVARAVGFFGRSTIVIEGVVLAVVGLWLCGGGVLFNGLREEGGVLSGGERQAGFVLILEVR